MSKSILNSAPKSFRYNSKRPFYVALFAVLYLGWKIFTQENLGQNWQSPFLWVVPIVLGVAAFKMWRRVILTIGDTEIKVYALFGPGEKSYKHSGFKSLWIENGRLYVLKEDPDTEEMRRRFIIAGWALRQADWGLLSSQIQEAHNSEPRISE